MSYTAKTDWTNDNTVMPADFNRVEQGIADAHTLVALASRRSFNGFIYGELATGAGELVFIVPYAMSISKVRVAAGTAPTGTGSSIIVDVHKNGTTIFTTQSNRPAIAAGSTAGTSGTPNVISVAEGDILTVDIDQVGNTTPGSNLSIAIIGGVA